MRRSKASATAKVIAAATLLLATEKHPVDVVDPAAEKWSRRFLASSFFGRMLAGSMKFFLARRFWHLIENLTFPGIVAHYGHRKRWIEHHSRTAVHDGVRHVVILGAGFDSLGIRLAHDFPWLKVTEVDHPATQAEKKIGFAAEGEMLPARFHLLECDLAQQTLPPALFANSAHTLFILEGLLMYLSPSKVTEIIQELRRSTPGPATLIFSYMMQWPNQRVGFSPPSRLIDAWLLWKKEPFAWGISDVLVPSFLAHMGFRLLKHCSAEELVHDAGLTPKLVGENLVLCEKCEATNF